MKPPPEVRASFRRHKGQAGISARAYRQQRLERFRRGLLGRRAIYLDINYWIDLQTAAAGAPRRPEFSELLSALRAGVASGGLMCPPSFSVLMELGKQKDPATRLATARLVDELCCGAGLMADDDLVAFEVAGLLLSTVVSQRPLPDRVRVWTPIGCMAADTGRLPPMPFSPTPQKRQQIEKAFFDTLLNATVEEVLAMEHPERTSPWQDLALTLNEGNAAHAHEIDTFEDLLAAEARGGAEASAPMIATAVEQLRLELGLTPGVLRTTAPEWPRLVAAALSQSERAQEAVPSLYIRSGLHALLRWNRKQRFKPNDIFDFSHAAAALGYCDLFLTEGPLKDMLGRGPLRLASATRCKVVAAPAEAVAAVQALLANQD